MHRRHMYSNTVTHSLDSDYLMYCVTAALGCITSVFVFVAMRTFLSTGRGSLGIQCYLDSTFLKE